MRLNLKYMDEKMFLHRKLVGKGEQANVLRCSFLSKSVVIKVPKKGHYWNSLKEAEIMRTLSHQNIVILIGVTTINRSISTVHEFMNGGNIRDYLRRYSGTYDHNKLRKYSFQICSALVYIARKGIIHRDIAARNVFLSIECNVAKLGDFGLATYSFQKNYVHKIPLRWTAPEALDGYSFSHKSDVWSFGIFMWEMFTGGNEPYTGFNQKTLQDVIRKGIHPQRPAHCSDETWFLMKCTWTRCANHRPSAADILYRMTIYHYS